MFEQTHMLSPSVTPLLVLVNVKSGGQQGMDLIRSFRKLLNPHQVYDLMNGGPLPGFVPAFILLENILHCCEFVTGKSGGRPTLCK